MASSSIAVHNPEVHALVSSPQTPIIKVVHEGGGDGSGSGGVNPVEWVAPVTQTTHLVTHALGRDPISVMVIIDGEETDFYSLTFPSPGATFLVAFDIAVRPVIRYI